MNRILLQKNSITFLSFLPLLSILILGLTSCTSSEESVPETIESEPTEWLAAWRETSPMLDVRSGAAHYAANGVIHMIGGIGGAVVQGKVGADVAASSAKMFMRSSEYTRVKADGTLAVWHTGPELNVERGYFSTASSNNYLYAVGGAHGPYGKSLLNSVERAEIKPDGTLGQWMLEENILNIPRRCVKLAVIDNYIYAFGGFGGILLDTVERAEIKPDGSLGEWLMANDRMTVARYIHGVEKAGNGVYMIGGHNKLTGGGIPYVEWSKAGEDGFFQSWSKRAELQIGRYGLATASHDGFIYAIGGLSGATYLDTIERTHIDGEGQLSAWSYTTPMPSAREGATAVVLENMIYLIGGSNNDGFRNSVSYATFNKQGEIGFEATLEEIQQHQSALLEDKEKKLELPHEGIVTEHIKTPQYSYLHIKMDDGVTVWLAVSTQDLREGERIQFPNGTIMKNFHSNSLNRNFPFIIFITEIQPLRMEAE